MTDRELKEFEQKYLKAKDSLKTTSAAYYKALGIYLANLRDTQ